MRPEIVFENIYNLMRFGAAATAVEVAGVTTLTTGNVYSLQNDMLVEVSGRVYQISNLTRTGVNEWTFDINASGLTVTRWDLALYYDYGRVLEINQTLKEKKEDPTNKNTRFPLMWLLTDIPKNRNFEIGYEASVIIAFIYLSEQNLKAKQRIVQKMEPVLDPLVSLFKKTITKSPGSKYFIYQEKNINIEETDKFKYGSVEGDKHLFDDITDAIQLEMTLRFFGENGNCNINF